MLYGVLNHLWQSTLVLLGAGLLTLLVRESSARLRYLLWWAASLKFLVPFALLAWLGTVVPWRPVATTAAPLMKLLSRAVAPLASSGASAKLPSDAPSWVWSQGIWITLAAMWVCGVIAVVSFWFQRWHRLRRVLRTSTQTGIVFPKPVRSSKTLHEPGILGIVRPVLLVPEGIEEQLTPEQLQAVLAHELCHVQRRDNLTAIVHMVVESLWRPGVLWRCFLSQSPCVLPYSTQAKTTDYTPSSLSRQLSTRHNAGCPL